MAPTAEEWQQLVEDELRQLAETGCDTWEQERRVSLIAEEGGPLQGRRLEELYAALQRLEPSADFTYEEPNELGLIREARPAGPRRLAVPLTDSALDDRTLGAWLGRVAGCMLGKPVEGWSRTKIADLMEACAVEVLRDYWPTPPANGATLLSPRHPALRQNLQCAVRDDDMDYTLTGLLILERYGREFTPRQVAEFWLAHLPYQRTYTAERAAYRNFVNGIWPPDSATYRNPYREWIGAQIRADVYGYVCPGRPEDAAALAFCDAQVSHVANGIYGEMWVAAMLAGAFVTDDPLKALQLGLTEIPQNCRLAEGLRKVIGWREDGVGAEQATALVLEEFGGYHQTHTINNAAIVALALLWGEGDFSRTIGLAVEAGLDTDCNGATAGSVMGVILGAQGIPDHWREPLNDRLETAVSGQTDLRFSKLSARTRELQRRE